VVVDLPDSSTFVTAINVFDRLGIRPHLIYQEPRLAVDMLRKGEVDAIVAIEGKPLQWLNQIQDRNLHLVPVEYAKPLQEEYLPSKLSSADYPNLVADGGSVETIAPKRCWPRITGRRTATATAASALLVDTMFDKVAQSAASAVPSEVEGNGAARDGVRLDPLQGGAGMARPQHAAAREARPCRRHQAPHRRRLPLHRPRACPAGSAVSRIPGMAGQPRQGQHQQVIGLAGNTVYDKTSPPSRGPSCFWDRRPDRAAAGCVYATITRAGIRGRNRVVIS
jgi:hypothetical protein